MLFHANTFKKIRKYIKNTQKKLYLSILCNK